MRGLSRTERRSLAAICEGFLPSLTPGPGDDPVLFATSAGDLHVADAAETAIGLLGPQQSAALRLLLRALDTPVAGLGLIGRPFRISSMSVVERERALRAMSTSVVPQVRSGFQALKRLARFLYYSGDANPIWPRIGYHPSPIAPATAPPALEVTRITAPVALECDVCVIGSGAGGGVVAARCAAAGKRVIVLEAGPSDQAADFRQRELEGTQRLFLDHGLTATRDAGIAMLAGSCIGGGTAVNWQTSIRTPDFIRDEWADRSGCRHFAEPTFGASLDRVCERIGVSTDESAVNANNAPLERGSRALGYACSRIERNARGCDVSQCGYCFFGCRVGGKQSTTVTYLRDAQQGDTTIVAECRVRRVTSASGRVTGVEATGRDPSGAEHAVTVRARTVVLAAGGLQSPAVLLRSSLELPALGRHLFLHPTTAVVGLYAGPIEAWIGPPQTVLCTEFARADGNYGFRLEAAPVHPGLLAMALPWTGSREHRRLMQQASHVSALIVLTRDATGGRVRVSRTGHAVVDYVPGRAERALLGRGIAAAARVHVAAGADEVLTLHTRGLRFRASAFTGGQEIDRCAERMAAARVDRNWATLFSAHQMGTCRMGRDARTAVCDGNGEVFGTRGLFIADASAFPASSGVNPMVTVMALADHVGQAVVSS